MANVDSHERGTEPSPVVLDYLGRVHTSLLESGRAANRMLLLNVTISLLLLGLVVGGVSAAGTIATGILDLRISQQVLVLGLQYLTALTFAHAWALAIAEDDLAKLTRTLYAELGFNHPSMQVASVQPYDVPGILQALSPRFTLGTRSGRIVTKAARFVVGWLLLLFPLGAELVTLVAFVMAAPGSLLTLVYGAPVVLTLSYLGLTTHWMRRAVQPVP